MAQINRRITLLTVKYLVDPNVAFITILGPPRGPAAFVIAQGSLRHVTKLAALTSIEIVIEVAAETGDIEALKRLYSTAPGGQFSQVGEDAAAKGHLSVVKWAWSKRIPWSAWVCHNAAENGHLRVIKWARKHGCPWNVYTCECAARNGHLAVLRWLRAHGCHWDEETCTEAGSKGHLDVLEWAWMNGCPRDALVLSTRVAHIGHLDVLQWLVDHGDATEVRVILEVASRSIHQHIVDWAQAMKEDI
ncbi:MAG: ankyrin repeat domain-containing protein [Patescibacteria group bacterium]|nr:ankyrin repeat domain-containing protein [Patescibacteria group bacterium]